METIFVVSNKGTIDKLKPGTVVNSVYKVEVLQRLIDEGYVVPKEDKPKQKKAAKKAAAEVDKDGSS